MKSVLSAILSILASRRRRLPVDVLISSIRNTVWKANRFCKERLRWLHLNLILYVQTSAAAWEGKLREY